MSDARGHFYKFSWAKSQSPESSYGVRAAGPYDAMRATLPEFSLTREMEDLNLAVSSAWTTTARQAGSTHGSTVTYQYPLRSQVPAYTVAGPLVQNPPWELLAELIGSLHTGTSAAGDVAAGSTASLVNLTATDVDEGACVYFANASSVVAQGWAQDSTGPAPYALTMFEDMRATPAAGNDLLGMLTAYAPSAGDPQPNPYSLWLQGPLDDHGIYLLGTVLTGATLVVATGKVPMLTLEHTFDGWEWDTSGSILTPAAYEELPAVMGIRGGRLRINGDQTGTDDPSGTCGLTEISFEFPTEVYNDPCAGKPQGYAGIEVARQPLRVSFQYPWTSDFIEPDGRSYWEKSLEDGVPFSLTAMAGDVVGSVFGARLPELVIVEQPTLEFGDGQTGMWSLVAEPKDTYDGDTGTTGPANSAVSLAIG